MPETNRELRRARDLAKRRAAGIGPHAHPDPLLTLDALFTASRCSSLHELSEYLGIAGNTMVRAQRDGISLWAADRYAVALGLHPFEVWGDEWYAAGVRYTWSGSLSCVSESVAS